MNTLYICFGWFVLKTMKPNSQYPFLVFASSNQYNTCYESIVFGVANVEGDQKPARKKTTVFEIVSQWGVFDTRRRVMLVQQEVKASWV